MERTAERTAKKQGEMDAFHGRKEETPDASNAEGSSVSEDVSCEHFGSTIKFEVRNLNPWLAIVILKESAVKRGRDDFFLHSTMQARKLNSSGDAAVTTAVYLCSSLFCYIGCIGVHLPSYYNHVQNQKQTSGENNPLDQYILVLAQTGRQ